MAGTLDALPNRAIAAEDTRPLILHVIHHLFIGGMENGLVNLVNRLDQYRHVIACVEDYSDFRLRITRPDVQVLALYRSRIGAGGVRRELFRLCRRLRPAVVHSRNLSGLDALLPARLAGVPSLVHSEHGWDVDNLDGKRWKPALLRRLHATLVDRYITVSKDLERFLTQRIGIRAARITQIYNGVDVERFVPAQAPADSGLPEHLRGPGLLRFGSVGRLQPVKDQASLLRATALVLQRRPDLRRVARLLLIGDGPLLAELRQLTADLGLADVVWLPGASGDVPRLMQALDFFVLPSLNEGISNTILEAMASGLPVLASRVGGNVELVEDGISGALFPAGDVPALSTLIERYLLDEALRRAHGLAARAAAVERYSLQAMVAAYAGVYRRLGWG
jgi:sugar transferase (PEP-CTERM/EpsH1 system associated)